MPDENVILVSCAGLVRGSLRDHWWLMTMLSLCLQGWREEWDGQQGVFKAKKPLPVYTWDESQP